MRGGGQRLLASTTPSTARTYAAARFTHQLHRPSPALRRVGQCVLQLRGRSMEPMESSPAMRRQGTATSAAGASDQSTTSDGPKRTLETLQFDNLALRTLPIDPVLENFPRKVLRSRMTFTRHPPHID